MENKKIDYYSNTSSYTNDTDYNKKITDVTIPNNKKLKYKIIDLDNNKVIFPGETVKFKYSIYSADDKSFDEAGNAL